jgi:hypothetical protein
MAVLPGVLGCSFDRLRTGSPCDVPFRYGNQHPAVVRWHTHLRGLATAIHEISGLKPPHPYWQIFFVETASKYSVIIMTIPY